MANKKILIFSTAYFPFVGGAEVAVKELTDRLAPEYGFDLITARLDSALPSIEEIGNVTVYRIGIGIKIVDKLMLPFVGALKAGKLNRANSYLCFWGIMATFASGAAYILNISRRLIGKKKVPIVLTLQEGDSEEYLKSKWLGLIDLSWRAALKRTNHLTAISNYLLVRARGMGYGGRASLIPNGVSIDKFSESGSAKSSDKTILITTSRLVEKNAVGDVIEAMKFLPESFKFRIVGTGPLENSLKDQAKALGVSDRVEFAGLVDPDKIPDELHKAHIFIRPSLSEGMGNSFIEAMAAGIPVIATPVGGIPDFLIDGETGLFVEPKSPRLIAFQVDKLVHDRVLRDKITIAAKRMVAERYDWDLVANKMKEEVFNHLLT